MKRIITVAFLIMLTACGNKNNTSEFSQGSENKTPAVQVLIDARKLGPAKSDEQQQIETAIADLQANRDKPAIGYWVGAFGKNKINIAIARVENGEASGYTVCAGNYRPLNGTVRVLNDSVYSFSMNEPGTDQYDGHFEFSANVKSGHMNGQWTPFKKDVVSAKNFDVIKTEYVYRTDVGRYPEGSSRLLTVTDVENLMTEELQAMRNEIYARHGYSFQNKEVRKQFDEASWYVPMGIDIRDNLTDIEVQNIDLIYQYENYQEENYDGFGR